MVTFAHRTKSIITKFDISAASLYKLRTHQTLVVTVDCMVELIVWMCGCDVACVQNEKAKLVIDHEVRKMQELDNQYESELRDWKQNLGFRKQVQTKHCCLLVSK